MEFWPDAAEAALQQLTMLITADGRWVLPESEEFLAALGDPNPDYDAVGFAIRNLGFIKFQVLDRIVTEIELHPRNVDRRALLQVEKLLGETGTNLFRIKHLETEWHSEISASAEHTIERLHELCAPVFEPPSNNRFSAETRDPSLLFNDRERREEGVGLLALKWRVAFAQFDSGVLSFAIEKGLVDRLMVAEIASPDVEPVFRYIGGGFDSFDQSFRFSGVGRRLQDFPDQAYGHWVAEYYKAVATSGQPRFDLVRATIAGPGRSKPRVTCYERLLLPWRTGSDKMLISVLSKPVSTGSEASSTRLPGAELDLTKSEKSS